MRRLNVYAPIHPYWARSYSLVHRRSLCYGVSLEPKPHIWVKRKNDRAAFTIMTEVGAKSWYLYDYCKDSIVREYKYLA